MRNLFDIVLRLLLRQALRRLPELLRQGDGKNAAADEASPPGTGRAGGTRSASTQRQSGRAAGSARPGRSADVGGARPPLGGARVPAADAAGPEPGAGPPPPIAARVRGRLSSRGGLQEAFALKAVLDPPLGLRRPRQ